MKNTGVYYRLALGVFVQALKDYGLPQGVQVNTVQGRRTAKENAIARKEAEEYLFGPEVETLLDMANININVHALRARLRAGLVDMAFINFFDPTDMGTQVLAGKEDTMDEIIEESV